MACSPLDEDVLCSISAAVRWSGGSNFFRPTVSFSTGADAGLSQPVRTRLDAASTARKRNRDPNLKVEIPVDSKLTAMGTALIFNALRESVRSEILAERFSVGSRPIGMPVFHLDILADESDGTIRIRDLNSTGVIAGSTVQSIAKPIARPVIV